MWIEKEWINLLTRVAEAWGDMFTRLDERRLAIGFGSSLLAGAVIAGAVNPQTRGASVAFGLLALAVLAGVLID